MGRSGSRCASSTPWSATSTGTSDRVLDALAVADEAGCDLAAFPELSLTGYPPEDLLLKPAFVVGEPAGLERVAAATTGCVAVVGFVDIAGADSDDLQTVEGLGRVGREEALRGDPRRLRNAAAVCESGRVAGRVPQEAPSQLRRLRRGAVVRTGLRDLLAFEVAGRHGRYLDLRGPLVPVRSRRRPRRWRSAISWST